MTDVLFVLITLAFFGVAIAFVRFCDGIVGVDSLPTVGPEDQSPGSTEATETADRK